MCARPNWMIGMVLLATIAVACGGPGRPSVSEWRTTWDAAQAVVPDVGDVELDHERCEAVLAELREIRPELKPAPDELVDEQMAAWAAYAEHLFFTCFENVEVRGAYAELDRYARQVEDALGSAD